MEWWFFGVWGRSAMFLVALIDVTIGLLTSLASLIGILYTSKLDFTFSGWTTADCVKNIGLWSILLVAIGEIWSGCKLFNGLCRRKPPQLYFWKFVIYLIPEVGGFVAPFYLVANYTEIIDFLMAKHPTLFVLHLLKINFFTILLFIFQIYSFLIVRGYGKRKEKKLRQLRRAFWTLERTNTTQEFPLLPIDSTLLPHCSNNAPFGTSSQLAPRNPLYPSLGDLNSPQDDLAQVIVHNTNNYHNLKHSKTETQFSELKKSCLRLGKLYEDSEFPTRLECCGNVAWKRPREIHPNPKFITDGVSRFDVVQGELGDCWFLAALANLTLHKNLFHQVVPEDNLCGFGSEYAGIFHFRFNDNGTWKDVIIDDRLPTQNGKLIYARSSDRQEFWSCLLEKAYAKFNGSYSALIGGYPGTAMENFTGKPILKFNIQDEIGGTSELFELLTGAMVTQKLVSACVLRDNGVNLKVGLPGGHAYSVTGVKEIHLRRSGKTMLVRIRNPWGDGMEWNGDWSDRHPLWSQVNKTIRKELQLLFQDDGEFWMPLKAFIRIFDLLEICLINEN